MANERIPNDPYRSPDDLYRTERADDELRRAARTDNELQIDPELAEGPASSGRLVLFAVAIALVLGAVFYGLNNSTINQAGTSSTSSTAQNTPVLPAHSPSGHARCNPARQHRPGRDDGRRSGAAADAAVFGADGHGREPVRQSADHGRAREVTLAA